jgi:phenylacetate-CoA ligase
MLDQYASYLLQKGIQLRFTPAAVITTSEVLTPVHRAHLEEAFSCRVYDEYGCGELGTIAHECDSGSLHVNAENLLVEIFDGDRQCEPGQRGEIVVTELNNFAMPLIRYRLGDFGVLARDKCSCGRTLPVLQEVSGRAYDLVYNREGRLFHAEFFMYIFEEVKNKGLGIKSFQVVQESYEKFAVLVVPDTSYGNETKALIRQRFREGYGDYAVIDFIEVKEIARRASGKMQLIVGLPPQPRATGPLHVSA